MDKKQAFNRTKYAYPNLQTSQASSFAATEDGYVIITGQEVEVALVIYDKTDIEKLLSICQTALAYPILQPPTRTYDIEPTLIPLQEPRRE